MKILVACEWFGKVRDAFTKLGHDATSCDLLPTEIPGKHYQGDVFDIINDGWDMMIAHPPCTHLSVSGASSFAKKKEDGRQQAALDFVKKLMDAPIHRICIENPVSIISSHIRKPDQIIQPYFFGDEATKTTCLWLKNLPKLYHNEKPNLFDATITHVSTGERYFWTDSKTGKRKSHPMWYAMAKVQNGNRSRERSVTFDGIAQAMANQWGALSPVLNKNVA